MRIICFAVLLLVFTTSLAGQSANTAATIHQLETYWLQAILDQDETWSTHLEEGSLSVEPVDIVALVRKRLVLDLTSGLSAAESKVRISGTIAVLSNEPGRARSFQFLDTFNKKNGKWEIVATSLSDLSNVPGSIRSKPIESELNDLENALTQADVTKDSTTLETIIAREFVSTSITGEVRDRSSWLATQRSEPIGSASITDIQVHSISDSMAVVTGLDVTTSNERSGQQTSHQDRFTDTWVRRAQGWQVVARQVTRLH